MMNRPTLFSRYALALLSALVCNVASATAQELPLPEVCSTIEMSVDTYAEGAVAEGWSRLTDPAAIREAAIATGEPLTASVIFLEALETAEDLERFQNLATREAEHRAGLEEVVYLAQDDRYLMIMSGFDITFVQVICVVAAADLPEIDALDLIRPDFIFPVAFRSLQEEVSQPLGGQIKTHVLAIDAPEDLAPRLRGPDAVISEATLAHELSFEELQEFFE